MIGLWYLLIYQVSAQENNPIPAITAANSHRLRSVAQINFDTMSEKFGTFSTGWFALSKNGERLAVTNAEGNFVTVGLDGTTDIIPPVIGDDNLPARPIDAIVSSDTVENDIFLYGDGTRYYVVYPSNLLLRVESEKVPQTLWQDQAFLYLELMPASILQLPQHIQTISPSLDANESDYPQIAYAPAADSDAVVRIGRIEPPYVVTSSTNGVIKLWNIARGELLVEVQNGTGKASVFGNINHAASHLVWRDEQSESLYLLNFQTGENRKIANLNGEYVQWFFLSDDASVILGVNIDFEPVIVAWDTKTGEKTVLGEYRECNRPQPDMARLSQDGSTLVIGCDTGLDMWRVQDLP